MTEPTGYQTACEAKFLAVDVNLFAADGCALPFDLYEDTAGAFVLLARAGQPISGKLLAPLIRRRGRAFVPQDQRAIVGSFIERRLAEINCSPCDDHVQAKIIHSAAEVILADMHANPLGGGNLRRCEVLARTLVSSLARGGPAFRSISALFRKDYYSFLHSLHVCVYGVALCRHVLSPDKAALRAFALGALSHDVGKTFLNPAILNKPGPLTAAEFAQVRRHANLGWDMLRLQGVTDPRIRLVVQGHHEKLDGSGYPLGLAGRQVQPVSRIAAIADIYDALTTDRPYRKAMTADEALDLMRTMAPHQLDAEYLEAFAGLIRQNRLAETVRPADR